MTCFKYSMSNYLNQTDFRSLNPTLDLSSYTDATVSGIISRVCAQVDNYLNYSLGLESITNEKSVGYISSKGDLVIFPRKKPVLSVSSIELVKGTESINLVLTNGSLNKYDIPSDQASIVYPGYELSTNSVSTLANFAELRGKLFYTQIDYVAGYQTIPDDILEAIDLLAKARFAANMNAGGASRVRQGEIEISYGNGGRNEFESDAYSILNKYKRVTP